MKYKIFLLTLPIILLSGFVSCLGSDPESTVIDNSDPQIYALSLSTDSIPELKTIFFSIDHRNGLIYNRDSLSYGTKLSKALCTMTTSATIVMFPEASGDTIYWKTTDSIDFSKPVRIVTTAYDGTREKTYTAKLNVRQQENNRIFWSRLTDRALNRNILLQKTVVLNGIYYTYTNIGYYAIYSSSSGRTWIEQRLSGFPSEPNLLETLIPFSDTLYIADASGKVYKSANAQLWTPASTDISVKTFIGIVPETRYSSALLCAVINKDDKYYFGATSDMITWKISGDTIPDNFPISGFGAASDSNPAAGYSGLIAVGGVTKQKKLLNTTWRTSDGIRWIRLTDEKASYFLPKEGAALAYYNDKYYLIGGRDTIYTNDVYVSVTNGVTWSKADYSHSITDLYSPRAYTSVYVLEGNRLILFGGENGNWLDDVWSGFFVK